MSSRKVEDCINALGIELQKKFYLPFTGSTTSAVIEEDYSIEETISIMDERMMNFIKEYVIPQDGMQAGERWFYTCCPYGAFSLFNEVRKHLGEKKLDPNLIWVGPINPGYPGNEWELHRHWDPDR